MFSDESALVKVKDEKIAELTQAQEKNQFAEIDQWIAEHGDEKEAIAFNIKVDVFHSKRLFQKLIFTICIFIIPSPTLARKRKNPLTDGSFKSV